MNNDSANLKTLFQLDPDITFLNHGSYGSCPIPVFEDYQKWQIMIEQHPVKFLQEDVYQYLDKSRSALGNYINCDKNDLIYVPLPQITFIIISLSLKLSNSILLIFTIDGDFCIKILLRAKSHNFTPLIFLAE